LFRPGQQLDSGGQSHNRKYCTPERLCQSNLAARRFLCRVNTTEEAPC
jgi:hypothetical protein